MAGYRLDQIQFLSTLPQYINIGNQPGTISISGAVANGATVNFSTTVPILAKNTFADVFITGSVTAKKTQIVSQNSVSLVYSYLSSESVTCFLSFAPTQLTVTVSIYNGTGFNITGLVPQTISVECIQYNIPF